LTVAALEGLVQRWQQLQPRERRMVAVGAVVFAALVGYLVAFEPAWQGRQRVAAELPTLRAQLSQMQALAAEARKLAGAAGTRDTPEQFREQVEQSIAAAGLRDRVTLLTQAEQLMDVRFEAVGFAPWLAWFDTALREMRMRVVDVSIERTATPGQVSARLTLELPGQAP
jgi:general secretion pathway protein M